jgi:hypothetical protein
MAGDKPKLRRNTPAKAAIFEIERVIFFSRPSSESGWLNERSLIKEVQ